MMTICGGEVYRDAEFDPARVTVAL
jgi:hypothetical protein